MADSKDIRRAAIARSEGLRIIESVLGRGEIPILGLYLYTAVAKMLDGVRRSPKFRKISPHVIGTPSILLVKPRISQSELATYLGCTRATAGKQVAICMRHGWIRRTRSLADRRSYLLELTPSGRRMLRGVADIVAEHESSIATSLSAHDRATLRRLLQRFIVS